MRVPVLKSIALGHGPISSTPCYRDDRVGHVADSGVGNCVGSYAPIFIRSVDLNDGRPKNVTDARIVCPTSIEVHFGGNGVAESGILHNDFRKRGIEIQSRNTHVTLPSDVAPVGKNRRGSQMPWLGLLR